VAATIVGERGEDGVVEGTNEHDLVLKFLDRGSQVKIGDLVETSGLGQAFPPGVPIGWVEGIEPDPRQLFLQAKLHPAARSNQLRVVLILAMNGASR
jgi:rod shape-determining protein MreC